MYLSCLILSFLKNLEELDKNKWRKNFDCFYDFADVRTEKKYDSIYD